MRRAVLSGERDWRPSDPPRSRSTSARECWDDKDYLHLSTGFFMYIISHCHPAHVVETHNASHFAAQHCLYDLARTTHDLCNITVARIQCMYGALIQQQGR
jgi:hypothetical protein